MQQTSSRRVIWNGEWVEGAARVANKEMKGRGRRTEHESRERPQGTRIGG